MLASTFHSALIEVAAAHPAMPAIVVAGETVSYDELVERIDDKVHSYGKKGVGDGTPVAVVADDPVHFLTDSLALLKLRAFGLLVPGDITRWEFERLQAQVGFEAVLLSGSNFGLTMDPSEGRGCFQFDPGPRRDLAAPCLGYLTSGSSGQPKIAVRSEGALLVEAGAMQHDLALEPGRRVGCILPLSHSYGFGVSVAALASGASLFVYPKLPASGYLTAFRRDGIRLLPLVPAQLRLLADAAQVADLGGLSVLSAGAHLDKRTVVAAKERLGCAIGQVYGSSETGIMTVAPPGEGEDSVGAPASHVRLKLEALPVEWGNAADGAEGIVSVRTEALFDGYLTEQGLDRTSLGSGWFSTGDLARLSENDVILLGRMSSAINVAGYKVSPEEVESVLMEFPGVRQALVLGVADPLTQQRLKAYVSPADIDLASLRAFSRERLSGWKCPQAYQAIAALATTPSGKVIRIQNPEAS